MRAVHKVAGQAVVLDRPNIDTDQIIPAAWLKRVERTGFGPGLFSAWRTDPGFVLNQPGARRTRRSWSPGPTSAAARPGSTLSGRCRTSASRRSSPRASPTSSATTASARACSPPRPTRQTVSALGAALAADPTATVTARRSRADHHACRATSLNFDFALPDYARWRLLEGLDDIGITLRHADEIAAFEDQRSVWLPSSGPRTPAMT